MRRLLPFVLLLACKGGDDTAIEPEPCTDADGDGSCAESGDCNDTDALISSDASDVPYNGRDENCDGKDNTDVDKDGFDGPAGVGPDCNDGNPEINPGMPEICRDSLDIDENCDGVALAADCDSDGYDILAGGDCDDDDATINPGVATDPPYDGVDQDCDNWSDYDADQDGHDGEGYGDGDDCNDADPANHPDAVEHWDGLDEDCNGLDQLGSSDSWKTYNGSLDDVAWTASIAVLNDVDGDGFLDIFAGDPFRGEKDNGGGYVMSTGLDEGRTDEAAFKSFYGSKKGEYFGWSAENAGDVDQDGLDDLIVGVPLYESSKDVFGAAMLFLGTELADGSIVGSAGARAKMFGGAYSGLMVAGLGDLDGDGFTDLATATDHLGLLSIAIFSGQRVKNGGSFAADAAVATIDDQTAFGGAVVGKRDLDGDGQLDIVFGRTTPDWACAGACGGRNRVYVAGADELSGTVDPTPLLSITGPTEGALGHTINLLGDLDGDGYEQLAIADPTTAALDGGLYGGTVYVVDFDDLVDNKSIDDIAEWTITAEEGNEFLRVSRRSIDHDGDGVNDLMVGMPGNIDVLSAFASDPFTTYGDGYVFLLDGQKILDGGASRLTDATSSFTSSLYGSTFGMSLDVADFDGDGLGDVAIGGPNYGYGKMFLFQSEL